jgi:hypothetical protein
MSSRLLDEVLSAKQMRQPLWADRSDPAQLDALRVYTKNQRDYLRGAKRFLADSLSEYYFALTDREFFEPVKDTGDLRLPSPSWIEMRRPSCIRSKVHGTRDWELEIQAWGALFISSPPPLVNFCLWLGWPDGVQPSVVASFALEADGKIRNQRDPRHGEVISLVPIGAGRKQTDGLHEVIQRESQLLWPIYEAISMLNARTVKVSLVNGYETLELALPANSEFPS